MIDNVYGDYHHLNMFIGVDDSGWLVLSKVYRDL